MFRKRTARSAISGRPGRTGISETRVSTSPGIGAASLAPFRRGYAPEGIAATIDGGHVPEYNTPNSVMPNNEMPSGALMLLILRVLRPGPLHGYAIAQRIHVLSSEVLRVEEGALYPTLQKILLKGWVHSEWGVSETNRKVRFYRLTPAGRKQLDAQMAAYERLHRAIQSVLRTA
jgi:PadR family transcriptional regulator PadR